MKVLIIKSGGVGDLVLATPVFRCLYRTFETTEIHLLTAKATAHVFQANPYIHTIHRLEDINSEKLEGLGFDRVVDLDGNEGSHAISSPLSAETTVIKNPSFLSVMLRKLFGRGEADKMKQNLDVIRKLGAIDDGEGLDYFIPQESQVPKQDIPTSHQLGYIAIVISDLPKVFSAEKVKELCASIDHPIILLGDRSDSLTAEGIRRADGVKIYSACGKFSLHETADLIRHARLVISPATSLFYITLALKRPVIQIKPNSTIAQIKTRIDFLPQSP